MCSVQMIYIIYFGTLCCRLKISAHRLQRISFYNVTTEMKNCVKAYKKNTTTYTETKSTNISQKQTFSTLSGYK